MFDLFPRKAQNLLDGGTQKNAQFVVVGDRDGHRNILSWHESEWLAKRAAHEARRLGATFAQSYPAPGGNAMGIIAQSYQKDARRHG